MLSPLRSSYFVAAFLLSAAVAKPAAITLNGTCELGNCSSVDSVSNGQSVGPANFNFNYSFADGDIYNLSGTYSASYSTINGSSIGLGLSATYTGSSPSVGNDVLTFDLLQNYFDNSAGSFDGTYHETAPVTLSGNVGAGSTVTAQLSYDGQGIGLLGPYGPGTNLGQQSAYLTGLDGNYLDADFNFTFHFLAGTQPGAGGTSPAPTPEPALLLPLGAGFLALISRLKHRKSQAPVATDHQ